MLDHLSIQCADLAASAGFYDAMLAPLGGQRVMDFGEAIGYGAEVLYQPRLWPEYHATYYGAFVRDPDGNNVEAVCQRPEQGPPLVVWPARSRADARPSRR